MVILPACSMLNMNQFQNIGLDTRSKFNGCQPVKLTRHVEKCLRATWRSPSMFKAVEDRPHAASESERYYRAARLHAGRNDTELSYCVNAQPTESAMAPEGISSRDLQSCYWVGGLYFLNNHSPEGM